MSLAALSWQTGMLAWAALCVGLLAMAHTVISYRRVALVAPKHWAMGLACVRLITIALCVVIAFQPTLTQNESADARRAVRIIVDDSPSMSIVDANRTTTSALRVSQALENLPPDTEPGVLEIYKQVIAMMPTLLQTSRRLDEASVSGVDGAAVAEADRVMREQIQTLRDLLGSLRKKSGDDPKLLALLNAADESVSDRKQLGAFQQSLAQLGDEVRRLDDRDTGRRVEADPASRQAVDKIRATSRIAIADNASGVLSASWKDRFNVTTQRLSEDAGRTLDDTPLLATLRRQIESAAGREPAAVVVLSDFRSTELQQAIPPVLTAAGVPIYAVQIGADDTRPDVRVVGIEAPATVLRGETIDVSVALRQRNTINIPVVISATDGRTTESRTITFTSDAQTERFVFKNAAPPSGVIKIAAAPVTGEVDNANNAASATVNVIDRKLNVMLVSGSAGWDVQYVRNALSRLPWVEFSEQLLVDESQNTACRFTPEVILKQDVFVLCDLRPSTMSTAQLDALHQSIVQRGASAVFIPGDADVWNQMATQPLLAALLPQRSGQKASWRQTPSITPPVVLEPAPDAAGHPLLSLGNTADQTASAWRARPPLYRLLTIGELKPASRSVLVDRATRLPVLCEANVGAGRVICLLTNETWRWRRVIGGDAHDRFWTQLVRYLFDTPYNVTDGDWSLAVDRSEAPLGALIRVRAKRPANITGPLSAELRQSDRLIDTFWLEETMSGSARWSAGVSATAPGDYTIQLNRPGASPLTVPVKIISATGVELADTSPDNTLAKQIADATGASLLDITELRDLPRFIDQTQARQPLASVFYLWCSPYVFCALIGLLGLEWALRKQAGLI